MYGTQTHHRQNGCRDMFENDVKMHGTQTNVSISKGYAQFENDVKCMCMVLKLKS